MEKRLIETFSQGAGAAHGTCVRSVISRSLKKWSTNASRLLMLRHQPTVNLSDPLQGRGMPARQVSMGLHEAASHYYYPGWHEPGSAITLGINQRVWGSLNNSVRRLLESVAAGEYLTSLSEFNVNNANALQLLRSNDTVKFHKSDDAMIKNFAAISEDVVREAGSADANSRAVYESFISFRQSIRDWTSVGEGAYRDAYRSLESASPTSVL